MREISPTENWLLITLGMALSGVLYSLVVFPNEPLIIGAIFAVAMGVPMISFERRIFLRPLYRRIEKLPTVAFIAAALIIYEILMSAGYAVAAALLSWLGFLKPRSAIDLLVMPFDVFLYALAVCALIVFILRVRDLLGRDIFTSMLISRYRAPVKEERVFLFIDLADSTSYAERHGDLRAQQFLKALFAAFAEPVRRYNGAIDDYVGDAAIVTWPLARGVKHARCIRCVFDILDDIETNAEAWQKKFGQVPRLRAALHGGPIITAEIGIDRHKITYFGDTVNTTSRLEALCKSLNQQVLISTDLAQRMNVPDTFSLEDLGTHAVKGRGQALGVMALAGRKLAPVIAPFELRIPAE
ncbi:MAG TPA: adenylate/guanylate cyclase domain-containing protein [Pararhizobium sp.]|uniref:adenylate/guanylate cyclase domain-containing protein n=1 Tax=Pararhizobium sp. TaxID=1977563 RepID=UPI002BCB54C7|nr:adenylate/guanylate cyclase domain-containing protein [Pararhizobium sp.]HTO30205.1 adenylate/guanylate cyclase domain-containing protein [Pararhizobium sp.]